MADANIIMNVAKSLVQVERLITGAAYLMGCAFLFKAIYTLKTYGESRTMMSSSASIKEPVAYLIVGTMLIYFPTALEIVLSTSFGEKSILQYAPVSSKNSTLNAIFGNGSLVARPLMMVIKIIGLVAFVRGWVLIARSASQGQPPGGMGKGFIHVFGGTLAINIAGTLHLINNTLYGTV